MMSGEVLAKMMQENLLKEGFSLSKQNEKFCKAISKAITEHIKQAALANPNTGKIS